MLGRITQSIQDFAGAVDWNNQEIRDPDIGGSIHIFNGPAKHLVLREPVLQDPDQFLPESHRS